MRILVTGASGFVGGYLVRHLAAGHEVMALVRHKEQAPMREDILLIEGDLTRPGDLPNLPAGIESIIHLAQANVAFPEDANQLLAVNTGSTQTLLDYGRCIGIGRFIFASSGTVYGFGNLPFRETDPVIPHNFYAATKVFSEKLIHLYQPYFKTVILRLFFPYGPGQRGRLIPRLIEQVRKGYPVILNDGGRPYCNPIYVDDLVLAIERTLDLDMEGNECLNIAGDEVVSIRMLAKMIGEVLGRLPIFEEGPSGSAGDLVGDNSCMHRLLNLSPLVPLAEGLRRVISESRNEIRPG